MHFISVGYSAILCLVQVAQRYKDDKYFLAHHPHPCENLL